MSFLSDIPPIRCLVRNEFLRDRRDGHGQFTHAYVFGVRGVPGRTLGFQALLEHGAQWAELPIHAMAQTVNAPRRELHDICPWDCFSYRLTVHRFAYLKGMRCGVRHFDGRWERAEYLFTIDWADDGTPSGGTFAEQPEQHKNHHVVALLDGNFGAFPNNMLLWADDCFTEWPEDGRMPPVRSTFHAYSGELEKPLDLPKRRRR